MSLSGADALIDDAAEGRMKSFAGACAILAAVATAPAAMAADYATTTTYEATVVEPAPFYRGFSGRLPACGDSGVIGRITSAFAARERGYWGSDLALEALGHPREIGYRSWGPSFVPRRFCAAETVTTDRRPRRVFYEIIEGDGFAGMGWGVNWCVTGLDRHRAFAPGCKMVRP